MIAGIYLVLTGVSGFWFGSLVDHHRKKVVMIGSSVASLVIYAVSLAGYLLVPEERWADVAAVELWVFVLVVMCGVIAGNIRGIALVFTLAGLLGTVVTLFALGSRSYRALSAAYAGEAEPRSRSVA